MKTTSLLSVAAFTLLAGAGFALPATAAPLAATCNVNHSAYINDNASSIQQQLNDKGINANLVESYNGCVRAFVTKTNGTQTMEYFQPYSLQKVEI